VAARDFGHRQHVEVVWCYLQALPPEEVLPRMVAGIQNLARVLEVPNLYQEALTRAWVERITEAWEANPGEDFAAFVEIHPELLVKDGYRR
jgi:hypothetical protein